MIAATLASLVLRADAQIAGLPGPPEGVKPTFVRLGKPVNPGRRLTPWQAPLGFEVSLSHHEDLKHQSPPPVPLGGDHIAVDPNSTPAPPAADAEFPGPTNNGWIPYDGAIAVGPTYIVAMANSTWTVYSKAGGPPVRASEGLDVIFGTGVNDAPFDPKCFYDSGHYVMLATYISGSNARMYVAVSKTSDPTSAVDSNGWWVYTFNWRLDGTTDTSNWGDFPGLGYDDNSIYINTNQYSISGGSFQYSKVRVLSKAQLYTGAGATYVDFTHLLNADGTAAFTPKPARCLSSSTSGYLLNTRPGGGSSVTLWRIDNGPTSPTLTRVATVSVGNYAVPPDAPQKGGRNLVATGDCRTQDVVFRNGSIYTAFTEKTGTTRKNQACALRYLQITNAGAKTRDLTYAGASGVSLYYPAVSADSLGNVAMNYSRSSSTEYIGAYAAKLPVGATNFGASSTLASGNTYMIQSRWGDYSGVHNDGADLWFMTGVGNSSVWGTDISKITLP
jgi:hypothetical protein